MTENDGYSIKDIAIIISNFPCTWHSASLNAGNYLPVTFPKLSFKQPRKMADSTWRSYWEMQ